MSAVYLDSLAVNDLEDAEGRIRAFPGVRAYNLVAGPYNVVVDAWLRSTAEAHDLAWRMGQAVPALRIQDHSIVLRMIKHVGPS